MCKSFDKPLKVLARFAAELDWYDLREFRHRTTTWYESGLSEGRSSDLFLQINEAPTGQTRTYVGAVYAMRYRICSGWHPFTLHAAEEQLLAEAAKVERWLHRRWFESHNVRRQYRQLHPECANYSWTRIREEGPPYSQRGPFS